MTEMATVCTSGERPDAIGWRSSHSILIECKTSRADFRVDASKPFRRDATRGMGSLRFFMAPVGIIRATELPAGWGLLEVGERVTLVAGGNPKQWPEKWGDYYHRQRAQDCEMAMLLSGLNRVRVGLGEGRFREVLHTRLAAKAVAA